MIMAALAPAIEIDFQSVEIVDIRVSIASVQRLRSFLPLCLLYVMYTVQYPAIPLAGPTKIRKRRVKT